MCLDSNTSHLNVHEATEVPPNDLRLLLSVIHDRVRQTVEYARQWWIYRVKRFFFHYATCAFFPVRDFYQTLGRCSITVFFHEPPGTHFRFTLPITSSTKFSATLSKESKRHESEVAGLIDHQATIKILLGNVDTLAEILQYIVTTRSRLTEIGRSDVKVSQVDPGLCQFRRRYYNIVRQHRTRYGRFSGLVD